MDYRGRSTFFIDRTFKVHIVCRKAQLSFWRITDPYTPRQRYILALSLLDFFGDILEIIRRLLGDFEEITIENTFRRFFWRLIGYFNGDFIGDEVGDKIR